MRKQLVFFVEFEDEKPGTLARAKPFPVPFKMDDVGIIWILLRCRDRNLHPKLPFSPVHGVNAFAEDPMHDWNIDSSGQFRYASRVAEQPVWILVELKPTTRKISHL